MSDAKHNPDILPKFNQTIANRPSKYETSNVIWKKITQGDDVPVIETDNNAVMSRLSDELSKRNNEKKFVKKKIGARLDVIADEPDVHIEQNTPDFTHLKKMVISENDKLQKEKEQFNKLLAELDEII